MPRFYYTLPLAIGFAALTALVETDRCRCPGHLIHRYCSFCDGDQFAGGSLLWGLAVLPTGGERKPAAYRAYLALSTGALYGDRLFLWAAGFHPSYMENVAVRGNAFSAAAVVRTVSTGQVCAGRSTVYWGNGGSLAHCGGGSGGICWLRGDLFRSPGVVWQLGAGATLCMRCWRATGRCWRFRRRRGWVGGGERGPKGSRFIGWVALAFCCCCGVAVFVGAGLVSPVSPPARIVALGVHWRCWRRRGVSWRPRRTARGQGCWGGPLSQAVAALYFQGRRGAPGGPLRICTIDDDGGGRAVDDASRWDRGGSAVVADRVWEVVARQGVSRRGGRAR